MTDKITPAKSITVGPSASLEVADPRCVVDEKWVRETVAYARQHFPTAVVLEITHGFRRVVAINLETGEMVEPVSKADTQ